MTLTYYEQKTLGEWHPRSSTTPIVTKEGREVRVGGLGRETRRVKEVAAKYEAYPLDVLQAIYGNDHEQPKEPLAIAGPT